MEKVVSTSMRAFKNESLEAIMKFAQQLLAPFDQASMTMVIGVSLLAAILVLVYSLTSASRVTKRYSSFAAIGCMAIGLASWFATTDNFQTGYDVAHARITSIDARLPQSTDGHFWVYAKVNGVEAPFLIDTGASTTVVTPDLADRAGMFSLENPSIEIELVNGKIRAQRLAMNEIDIGGVVRSNLDAVVIESGNTNLLGMNFLNSLKAWRIEGHELIISF